MNRRTLLGLPVAGILALSACGTPAGTNASHARSTVPSDAQSGTPQRIAYGSGTQQFGELHLPRKGSTPKGLVILIHGGFWLAEYDLTLGSPLAASLAGNGWAAWNIEYRRVDDGGGDPATMDDVAAAIDKVADLGLASSTLKKIVALGHSAGGQLAAFAASRGRFSNWAPTRVELTHVITQAGVMDLQAASTEDLGNGAVKKFLGHRPGASDDPIDPIRQVPLDQPVWCVHGDADSTVPRSQSTAYVAAATAAGARAEFVSVPGDHFALITTTSSAWARTLKIFDSIA